ncbi:MAG: adenosylmethionine--8-amino-7-oxononanoate transaminase [Bacteroidota bacterium]|nr:adenosylmethionine--8-amino-7-oxononanoate transaminase [Bacteroidota bacterium]
MELQEIDKNHLWHPLTQHQLYPDHIAIDKAEGVLLFDTEGNQYIDAISSWYTCMYGHCNPYITEKVSTQMKKLDHVVFTGFTHQPAVELANKLISILPKNQQKLFFSDNGSTSVDIAIKMALQYHFNKGEKKQKIIAFEDGFHGDTFGAMSVSGLSIYNGSFEDYFLQVERIPTPNKKNFQEVKNLLLKHSKTNDIAAFIYEPLVQGAAAMQMHKPEHLNELIEIAKNHNIITIADEVMTGFGKTGKYFASQHMKNLPDIICLSKSLTGGLVPMAITTCTLEIFNAFLSDKMEKGFFHGHTYSANPTSCAAASAGIDLLQSDEIQQNIKMIISSHEEFNQRVKDHPKVKKTRQQGVIFALDLDLTTERYGNLRFKLFDFFMKKGVYLRPLGSTVYILAPFTTSKKQLQKIYAAIEESREVF